VDLEDGVRRGTLAWDDVQKRLLKESGKADIVKKALKQAHDHIAAARLKGKERSDALAQTFRISAISLMVIAARQTFQRRYADIMNGEYHEELLMDSTCAVPFALSKLSTRLRRHTSKTYR
jgi:dGTPase